jgi:hypothetical protein
MSCKKILFIDKPPDADEEQGHIIRKRTSSPMKDRPYREFIGQS